MPKVSKWFQKMLEEIENDPEANTYELLYMITDDIAWVMEQQGMTKKDLAKKAGVSLRQVKRFMNTPTNTQLYQVVRFMQAVGLRLTYNRLKDDNGVSGHDDIELGVRRVPCCDGGKIHMGNFTELQLRAAEESRDEIRQMYQDAIYKYYREQADRDLDS